MLHHPRFVAVVFAAAVACDPSSQGGRNAGSPEGHAGTGGLPADGGAAGDMLAGTPDAGNLGTRSSGGTGGHGTQPAAHGSGGSSQGGGGRSTNGGSAGRTSTTHEGDEQDPSAGAAGESAAAGAAASGGVIGDAGAAGERATGGAGNDEPSPVFVPGFSERKWLRSKTGIDWVLEEELTGFASPTPPRTRLRRLTHDLSTRALFQPPDGAYLSDVCVHPSGEISAVLVSPNDEISLTRLDQNLEPLGTLALHDPAVAVDPHAENSGVTDLLATPFTWDAARIGANGEAVFMVVVTTLNSVIGYRSSFSGGSWAAPARTLIEPAGALTPFLPTGGSFDTFGAIFSRFRAPLDMDPDGNAYVVVWAHPPRIRDHASVFGDGVTRLPTDPASPSTSDSDMLLTKLDASGNRLWTRVVGSEHEDEPYALRATRDAVAVVGRARRFPGFDNTVWDALVSVASASGDATRTVTLKLDASSILLGVDARPSGGWLLAGSDGWSQNPDGLSVLSNGQKLLVELPDLDRTPDRRALAAGPRHNELRSVLALANGIAFAGHEDGPIMHSGDADPSAIHATGVLGSLPP